MDGSPVKGANENAVDRESAYEMLKARAEQASRAAAEEAPRQETPREERKPAGRRNDTVVEALVKSAARSVGSTVGRQLVRGIMGSIFGRRR